MSETETEPEDLMVESVGLVSTPVQEHKDGGGSREEKDLALIIVIIILPEQRYPIYHISHWRQSLSPSES